MGVTDIDRFVARRVYVQLDTLLETSVDLAEVAGAPSLLSLNSYKNYSPGCRVRCSIHSSPLKTDCLVGDHGDG